MILRVGCIIDANFIIAAPKVGFDHLNVAEGDAAGLRAAGDLQIRSHAESDDAAMAVAAGNPELAVDGGIGPGGTILKRELTQIGIAVTVSDGRDLPRPSLARADRDLEILADEIGQQGDASDVLASSRATAISEPNSTRIVAFVASASGVNWRTTPSAEVNAPVSFPTLSLSNMNR